MSEVPEGFEVMPPFGPFHELVGPIYYQRTAPGFTVGLRAEEKHRNKGVMLHGGMIAMFADTAFTWAVKYSQEPPVSAVTANLSLHLMGNAQPGDWLEARVEIARPGRRVVFANCFIWANGLRIAQAMAQFQVREG
jgi:acyl-coenzyme A thioesterase PaaI-like protein